MLKFKDYLEEASASSQISKIADMTDNNDHGGAILAGLKLISAPKDMVNSLKDIMKAHEKAGSMSSSLLKDRKNIYDSMMKIAKKKLSSKDFDNLHGAF